MARSPRPSDDREPPPDPRARLDLNELGELSAPGARRRKAAKPSKLREFLGLKPARAGAASTRPAAKAKVRETEYVDERSPWFTKAAEFPAESGMEAKLKFCLRYAVLAPSSHNSQPWRFAIDGRTCLLWADRTKALPVSDPEDRELTISCGCALAALRVTLRRFGLEATVKHLPDPKRPDLLARVKVDGPMRNPPSAEDLRQFEAIADRRTTRQRFEPRSVPASIVKALADAAEEAGAAFVPVIGDEQRTRLARLIHEADVLQLGGRAFRRELAMWLHHNRSKAHDGIPGYAMGMNELQSLAAPLVVRTFDLGSGRGAQDEQLALHSPLLAVIGSERDDPAAWLKVGEGLMAVLLKATSVGLTASYLNQPVEVPEMRVHLKRLMPESGWPQIVMRMGFGPKSPHTPRRSVDEVMLH
jgi:hypothetical protein